MGHSKLSRANIGVIVECYDAFGARMSDLTMHTEHWTECSISRGFIMDELEKRDPAAFEKWIDSDVESPRSFFISEK